MPQHDQESQTQNPPRRALEYFRAKAYDISWNWWDTWESAHARTFTVAKATRLPVLEAIRAALDEALVAASVGAWGTASVGAEVLHSPDTRAKTRAEFVRDLTPKLKHLGWWGQQIIVNEQGDAHEVQLGSRRRLEIIYDTNMRCAHSAARFREQHENAASRPYWLYDARSNQCIHPTHAVLDGHVFRHDDPIWDTHYPPNGWNCRCRVQAITKTQMESRNLTVRESKGDLQEVEQVVGTNKITRKTIKRPGTAYEFRDSNGKPQTLLPDPGWSYNPGKTGPTFGPVTGSPERLEAIVRDAYKRTWRTFGLPEQLPTILAPPRLPPIEQRNADKAKQQIRDALKEVGIQEIDIIRDDGEEDTIFGRIATPDGQGDIMLTDRFIDHVIDYNIDQAREVFANFILPSLSDPAEVWLQPHQIENRIVYRRVFVTAFEGGNTVALAQEDRCGSLSWTFYPEGRINRHRAGYLLYRRPGR